MKYFVITFPDTHNRDLFLAFVKRTEIAVPLIMELSKSIIVKCKDSTYTNLVESATAVLDAIGGHDDLTFEAMYHGAISESLE